MTIQRIFSSTLAAAALAGALVATTFSPTPAAAAIFLSAGIAPPAIPVYAQPISPGYGYIWTPGYWAWGDDGYYWVDGAWVYPPYDGALWTPGYWGWGDDGYFWSPGYWGLNVGYYGGINYGFGYFGAGYCGGYWRGGRFFYNGIYNHLGFRGYDHFVYNQRVNGFDGRPGGPAFTRNASAAAQRGGAFSRGAGINGNSFASRGGEQSGFRGGNFANGAERAAYNNSGSAAQRGYAQGSGYAQGNRYAQAGGYAQGNYVRGQEQSSFRGGQAAMAQPRQSFAAPQARSFSGGGFSSGGFGGGGFHGGGGGGGGFHGGGGGGRR